MDIIIYVIIFIIGIVFGSFYILAVYRIPKGQDITHTRSYCPKCNHKLSFLDLIPVFSYIFLRGKCRYCKEKIRPRYFILEILSGLLFLASAYLIGIKIETLNLIKIIDFSFIALYLTYIILIAGIDKENRKIQKGVSVYGIIISIMYMIYLCIVEQQANIYRYAIYLGIYIVILVLDTITLKKFAISNYTIGILLMITTMIIFTNEYIVATSIILTLLAIAIYILKKISIGFYLGVSNIIVLILTLLGNYYA